MHKLFLTLMLSLSMLLPTAEGNTIFCADEDIAQQKLKAKELFADRHKKESLEEAIKTMEGFFSKESDYETAALLSRAYYFLAEFSDQPEQKMEIYSKGLQYGESALNKIEDFAKALKETEKEEEALKVLTKSNMDGLYWAAANIAKWAKFAPFVKKVSSKSRVRALWDKVYELDTSYFYGGAYRFFGGYYALVPSITGDQDPVKSKEMFDKALNLAPQYLETKVLCAEAYCTHAKIADKELFRKLLNEVLDFPLESYPEIIPENTIAKEKAKKLLAQENELFD